MRDSTSPTRMPPRAMQMIWLKANPDKASQATAGVGSAPHLAGVFFQKQTATRYQFVPYRGAAPAMQDLLAGQMILPISCR